MSSQRILVIGVTGRVAGILVRQLVSLPNPPLIRGSTRQKPSADLPSGVEIMQGDLLKPASYPSLFEGTDSVFIYAIKDAPCDKITAAAKAHGVKRFVLLSSVTVEQRPTSDIGICHVRAEEAIKDAGLEYTFVRAGAFASNTRMLWAPVMAKTGKLWMTYPNAHAAPIGEEDIASVAVVGLTTDRLVNQAFLLTGPVSMSQQEQFQAINNLRKRQSKPEFELMLQSPEAWKEGMIQARGERFGAFADQLLDWWAERDGKSEKVSPSVAITGKPSQTFEE